MGDPLRRVGRACPMYKQMYTIQMAKSYSVADARAHLPEILDDVEAGKDVQLTRRGRPVALVLSPERYEMLRREHTSFIDAYRAFLDRHPAEDIGLEPAFVSSLRDRNPGRRVRL
jgi:prevent-host-death family protein